MRTPFKASRRVAAPFILATASLSLFVLHCSTDDGTQPVGMAGTTALPTSGAGGTANQGGSSSGMTSGGVTTAGGSTGTAGTGTAGTVGTAGTTSAAGASAGGGGGAGGGSAGASGSGGGGGGGSPLFAAVKTLMAKSCGVGKCHNAASGELDFQAMDGMLYQRLTQPVPAGSKHCVGSKAIVANDASSLLLQAIKAKGAVCMNGGGTEMIGQMPDNCPTKEGIACLTPAEQKIFADWVAAGAPM